MEPQFGHGLSLQRHGLNNGNEENDPPFIRGRYVSHTFADRSGEGETLWAVSRYEVAKILMTFVAPLDIIPFYLSNE